MAKQLEAKNESLVDIAHKELITRFVTLDLSPGSVWSEVELSNLLGIGRTPVREALQRMASDQLVTVIKRAGIMISNISIQDQIFVIETRRELERLVSLRAAKLALADERAQLNVIADSIEGAGNRDDVFAYLKFHFELKRFVALCARNPYAARALGPLHTLSQRFYFKYHRNFNNLHLVGRAHADLTRAIVSGDETAVVAHSAVVSDITDKFTRDLLLNHT
jgi:DNA-binding GntR family transcriptional regulator